MKKETENILGYEISTLEKTDCIKRIYSWIINGKTNKYFVCANPHSLEIAEKDAEFKTAIKNADLITPDGSGIILASRILQGRITKRVTGSGIFRELSITLNKSGKYKYFFLGSTRENLQLIKEKMGRDFPNIIVCESFSPPFKKEFSEHDNKLMIDKINKAEPDVLWVGMTAPKQEKWVYHNRNRLNVCFIGPVGAVFDFYVKTIVRSHPIFFKYGLEWFPRFIQQPGRLWKRMFISAPKFMLRVFKQKIF